MFAASTIFEERDSLILKGVALFCSALIAWRYTAGTPEPGYRLRQSVLTVTASCSFIDIGRYPSLFFPKVEVIHQGPAMVSEVCAQVCRIKLKRP